MGDNVHVEEVGKIKKLKFQGMKQVQWTSDSSLGALLALGDQDPHREMCEGILLGFPFHPIFLFWMPQCHGVLLAFGGRQDDEHPTEGRSASSKTPRTPSLRDTEKRMKLEARVPSEGEELGQVAGTPLQ